jgi:hypothetical protein
MQANRSQLARAAALMAVPAAVALVCGAGLGWMAFDAGREKEGESALREISAQGRLAVESFWSAIDVLRARAQGLLDARTARPGETPAGPILHWAEIAVADGGRLGAVRQSATNPAAQLGAAFEESYLGQALERLSLRELRENGVAAVRVRPDPGRASEWLGLGFAGADARTVLLILVDPAEAFPGLKRFAARGEAGTLRAYLVNADGNVLAHSLPAYNGASFSGTSVFAEAVRPLLQGTRVSGAGQYRAIDQLPVAAAYARPGNLPIGIVVERVERGSAPDAGGILERSVGKGLSVLGVLALLVLGCAWRLSAAPAPGPVSRPEPEAGAEPEAPEVEAVPPAPQDPVLNLQSIGSTESVSSALETISFREAEAETQMAENALRHELRASHEALRAAREENAAIARFEAEASRLRDPKLVATRLTRGVSELCSSPALFFAHHAGLGAAILQADAGFPGGEAPAAMNFPLEAAALKRIFDGDRRGEIVSLAEYPPLARVLMARLGVAHFEAWPITGYGHLGRQAVQPRLLGILVILLAGVETASRHDSLSRMMRATGLIYENALLSQ